MVLEVQVLTEMKGCQLEQEDMWRSRGYVPHPSSRWGSAGLALGFRMDCHGPRSERCFSIHQKRGSVSKRLPLLGMMAAAMVLGASVEIVPIAYHVNLTVISGILLGPSLIFLATLVVNVILALFGHGGITVIGLNTLILSIEGILGYYLFRLFWKIFKRLSPAVFLATFLALLVSTFSMVGVVSLGTSHYEELIHREDQQGNLRIRTIQREE